MKFSWQHVLVVLTVVGGMSFVCGGVGAESFPTDNLANWGQAGSENGSYQVGIDYVDGAYVTTLRSKTRRASGFGTHMRSLSSEFYRGKQVRLSAELRTEDVKKWAGLWMRVDSPRIPGLAFDNMSRRPIKGTTDWIRYEVVLPVAKNSSKISFGVLLSERGTVWMRNVQLEVVEDD